MLLYVFDVLLGAGLVCWLWLGVLMVFVYFSVRVFDWLLGEIVVCLALALVVVFWFRCGFIVAFYFG